MTFKGIATTIRNNEKQVEERAAKRAFLDRLKENDAFMEMIKIKKCAPVMGADYVAMYECTIDLYEENEHDMPM